MKVLTREQTEGAVARLVQLIELREIKQEVLAASSEVSQSTISKIMTGSKELGCEKYVPSEEVLKKLFNALWHKLSDILNESDRVGEEIYGYLATPLTCLSDAQDAGLRNVVQRIRKSQPIRSSLRHHSTSTGQAMYASQTARRHTRKPGVHHGSHTCLYPRFHHPILWYPKLAFSFAGSGRRGQESKDLVHHFA